MGGGIVRQVCQACGAVTIDLTAATDRFEATSAEAEAETSSVTHPER